MIESDGDKVLLTKDGWKVPEESTGGNGTIVLDESSTVFDISGASKEHFDSSTTESPTSDKNNRRRHEKDCKKGPFPSKVTSFKCENEWCLKVFKTVLNG